MNIKPNIRARHNLLLFSLLCIIAATCSCQKVIEQRKHYYYNKGMQLFNDNKYSKAAGEFENALQFDQRYVDAHYMRGMSYYYIGDYRAALESLQKASEARQEDIQLKLKIGECMLHTRETRGQGRRLMYVEYFNSVMLSLAGKNRAARMLMLKYYVAENKLTEAEELIARFLRDGEKDSSFYEVLVRFYLSKDKMPEVEDIALKHFSDTPDWMKTMQRIVDRFRSLENYDALRKIYTKIIEQAEDKLPYQKELAKLYRQQGEEEKEEKLYRVMLEDYPDMLEVKRDYMNFLNYYNKQSQIQSFINEEINKQPQNIELKKLLINFYVQTGQMQKAYQTVEKIIAAIPVTDKRYFEFQNILAGLHFRSGEYGQAKKIVEKILSENQLDRDARFLRCKIYLQERNALSAIGELRQLIIENPEVAEFNYYLGLAHEMHGERVLAEKAFRSALDVSSDYKDALLKWIAIYPKEGTLSEAELKIKKYLDLHPDDKEIKTLQQSIRDQKTGIITSSNVSEK